MVAQRWATCLHKFQSFHRAYGRLLAGALPDPTPSTKWFREWGREDEASMHERMNLWRQVTKEGVLGTGTGMGMGMEMGNGIGIEGKYDPSRQRSKDIRVS